MQKINLLRPVLVGPSDTMPTTGPVEMEATRAKALIERGIAEPIAEKAARAPENKMRPEPKNKAKV